MNGHDGTQSMDGSNSSIDKIKQKLQDLPGNPMEEEKFSIFRVPAHFRQNNKELYEPKIISIGPYYNDKDAFEAMEKHKLRYLRDYLYRNSRNNFELCVAELRGLESRARRCYFEEIKLLSDQFLTMMLLDGCFIIEFLMKWYYGSQDVIFDLGWVLPLIRSDLLLMENQIPLFVIQKLFDLLTSPDPVSAQENTPLGPTIALPLVEMLLEYLSQEERLTLPDRAPVEIKHILHFYHLSYVHSLRPNEVSAKTYSIQRWLNPIELVFVFLIFFRKLCFGKTKSTNGRFPSTIPSATELKEAGVTFQWKDTKSLLDISFQNGTLEIPIFLLEETRRSHLLNLVSFEQCETKFDMYLTSYVVFMSCLLKNERDVTLLQKMGIVNNLLATDDELLSFFIWLNSCSYMNYDTHYLKDLFIDVNRYYFSDWHRWKAKLNSWKATLKINYLSNPWSIISLIAAFALLALTVLQTLYTVLSYYYR